MAIAPEVSKLLSDHDVPYDILRHDLAFTAQEEAELAHVPGDNWAKTVIFIADAGEAIMAALPATWRVDVERLRTLVGAKTLRLADESEFTGRFPTCETGAMAPFGALYGQRTVVERHLAQDEEIVFNAGNHTEAVRMRYADFEHLARPIVGDFGHRKVARP